jgi:hypothetical protein
MESFPIQIRGFFDLIKAAQVIWDGAQRYAAAANPAGDADQVKKDLIWADTT